MQCRVLCRDATTFQRNILLKSHGVTSRNIVIVILIALRTTKNKPLNLPFPKRKEDYWRAGCVNSSETLCLRECYNQLVNNKMVWHWRSRHDDETQLQWDRFLKIVLHCEHEYPKDIAMWFPAVWILLARSLTTHTELYWGHAVAQLFEALRYDWKVAGSTPYAIFHCLNPSAFQRNEYLVVSPAEKGRRRPVRKADNLATYMCRPSRISGSLNLLEPYTRQSTALLIQVNYAALHYKHHPRA